MNEQKTELRRMREIHVPLLTPKIDFWCRPEGGLPWTLEHVETINRSSQNYEVPQIPDSRLFGKFEGHFPSEFAPPMLRKSENCVHMICGHSEFLQIFATVGSILASGRSEFPNHSEGLGSRSVALLYRLVLRIESLLFERSH
jgi:hypothetical protein